MKWHSIILYLHLLATAAMTGLIWFVQIVHYPMFADVPPEAFLLYEVEHQFRTSFVVIPFMTLELLTGLYLVFRIGGRFLEGREEKIVQLAFVLLVLIWGSTFFIQVPLHEQLALNADTAVIDQLVSTNWIRTISWSLRSVLLLMLVSPRLKITDSHHE